MKIAIQDREKGFSNEWINYCKENDIPYKVIDSYANNVFEQIADCDVVMWHWHHTDFAATLFARQFIYCLEFMGKTVFPNTNTCRFFDDKIGQKYLFEALGVNHIPTYIFYDRSAATEWMETAIFPKVFKLSKGAGSVNVLFAEDRQVAKKLIRTAFGKGFKTSSYYSEGGKRKITKTKSFDELLKNLRKIPGYIRKVIKNNALFGTQKGYAYFQDFIPNNDHDVRVVVIGDKAFVKKRFCPPGDFRASGADIGDYDHKNIKTDCVKVALDFSRRGEFQCMAYDFIYLDDRPMLIEMSYGFVTSIYPGYFDWNLQWHEGEINVYQEMIHNIVSKLSS